LHPSVLCRTSRACAHVAVPGTRAPADRLGYAEIARAERKPGTKGDTAPSDNPPVVVD
jgi:hypothetical protein